MAKGSNVPNHALVVTQYAEFGSLVQAFVDGHHELMTIIGDAGIGKTEEVRRRMQKKGETEWTLIKEKHSQLYLYRKLYESRLFPVVLDDLDGMFRSPDNTSILKCVCDSVLVKRVEWGSTHAAFERVDNPLPKAFESISRVCVIANEWQTINRNLAAVQDRGVLVFFRPSALEVHRQIARQAWFDDSEVFEFLGRNLFLITKPSFRLYLTAKHHKRSGLDWRNLILRTIESDADPKMILIARLLADSSYDQLPAPERARELAFQRLGGGSRATYHRVKRELVAKRGSFGLAGADGIKLEPTRIDPFSLAMAERRNQLEAMRDEIDDRNSLDSRAPSADLDDGDTDHPSPSKHPIAPAVAELRRRLEDAISAEDYEAAAELRDLIKNLERLSREAMG